MLVMASSTNEPGLTALDLACAWLKCILRLNLQVDFEPSIERVTETESPVQPSLARRHAPSRHWELAHHGAHHCEHAKCAAPLQMPLAVLAKIRIALLLPAAGLRIGLQSAIWQQLDKYTARDVAPQITRIAGGKNGLGCTMCIRMHALRLCFVSPPPGLLGITHALSPLGLPASLRRGTRASLAPWHAWGPT